MQSSLRATVFPSCLLAGTLLIIVAALLHPDLTHGSGADQLAMIARCVAWRAIHWAFLFGFVLSLTGLAGVVGRYIGTAGEAAVRAGIVVVTFAYGAWTIVVAFMLGAGWTLAQSQATQAVFVYDMVRPFALVSQRIAGFALGMSTVLLGWGALRARVDRPWLGWSGVATGSVAIALAVFFGEATMADQAAFAPPVLWQFVTAVVLFSGRGAAQPGRSSPTGSTGPG